MEKKYFDLSQTLLTGEFGNFKSSLGQKVDMHPRKAVESINSWFP